MTANELYTAVRFYLNRNTPNADLQSLVNAATGRLNTALRDHPRNIRVGDYTVPAGQSLLPLPYDILALRTIRCGSVVLQAYPPTLDVNKDCYGVSGAEGYIQRGNCVELTSVPTEPTVYRVEYYKTLDPVATNLTSNWVLQFFPDVYLYSVLSEAAVALKDKEQGPIWEKQASQRIQDLIAQGWNQNIGAAPRVRAA